MGTTPQPTRGSRFGLQQAADVVGTANGVTGLAGDQYVVVGVSPNGGMTLTLDIDRLRGVIGVAPRDVMCVVKSAAEHSGGTFQWEYTCQPVTKILTGPGSTRWALTGSELVAFNLAENINDDATGSTIPYGNGVFPDDLSEVGTFTITRIPDDNIVLVRNVLVKAEGDVFTNEYWIVAGGVINGITGACD